MTTFTQSYLAGSSTSGRSAADLLGGDYDLVLLCPSWDSRSTCIAGATDVRARKALVLMFTGEDAQGVKAASNAIIKDFADGISNEQEAVVGGSLDLEPLWSGIRDAMLSCRQKTRRALRVLIDLSACPRYYSIGAVALCLVRGVASHVNLFYSEGIYAPNRGESEIAFTSGQWRLVPMPFLGGACEPARGRLYVVSLGFEGAKTNRAISRGDPDRVSVLFPDPGVQPGYVEKTRRANRSLMQKYLLPSRQVIRAHAADAIEAWKALAAQSPDRTDGENSYYICCGTKPHSLALALRALVLGSPSVLYVVPEKHEVVSTEPTGVFWRFDIRDMTAV